MEFQKSRFAKLAGIGEDSHAAPAEESRLTHDQVLNEASEYPMMNDIADEYLAALQQTGSRQIPWMRYIRTTVDEFGTVNYISAEHGHIPRNHMESSDEYWAWLGASEDVIKRFNDDFPGIEFGIHSGGLR